jgi:GNAT superfamily N-acetyltransferase
MQLYRHYKNKPYKFIGTAKHSETLEDLVLYECRYKNESAALWVRPKGMFYENVEVEGQAVPRFAKVPLLIEGATEITAPLTETIGHIIVETMGSWDLGKFVARLKSQNGFYVSLAQIDAQVVGFKLGYQLDETCFYSWLGAVLEEHRGLGVGQALMTHQHQWCVEQGFKKVRTKTLGRYKEMLMFNLKNDFEVIGTEPTHEGPLKIILEKQFIPVDNFRD